MTMTNDTLFIVMKSDKNDVTQVNKVRAEHIEYVKR